MDGVHHVTPSLEVRRFAAPLAAAEALASEVAARLGVALQARAVAWLAVSGGTTPGPFLAALSRQALDWERVHVTLTDERWVPTDHARSNAQLVVNHLLTGEARHCHWHPLYTPGLTLAAGARALNAALAPMGGALDVAVLGIGEDGHTASLFPDGLPWDSTPPAFWVPARSPSGEERISLSLTALDRTHHRYLLFNGAGKLALVESLGRAAHNSPVAALLRQATSPIIAYAAMDGTS